EGRSKVSPPPPLTLGSDISGVVEKVGVDAGNFREADAVYGVTNPQFCGAQAEYAVVFAAMVAPKPRRLNDVEAASVPVVAVTAWQMLFDYANARAGQSVMILGAGGNVGSYALQLANRAKLRVIAVNGPQDWTPDPVDIVLDMVGGETRERAFGVVKPGGILVSVVAPGDSPARPDVRSAFFYVDVTTARLETITELLENGELTPQVGTVLPLEQVRTAHEMLAGAPHKRGKIVLQIRD
ncbi:MAG TPA: NADP-dependent oxidoreductase, partial [Bryobacteraceae bacterium]|nr:NADP-dependent oxidoreductase [Bryobacteraceae bacterium]